MTNEMRLQNDVLTMEALDEVTGATGDQLHELTKSFTSNNNVLNFFADAAELATKIKVGCIGNIPLAYAMENLLEKDMGIKANISVGWGGSGFREVGNSYTDMATGKALSHSDVAQRLKNYGNEIL